MDVDTKPSERFEEGMTWRSYLSIIYAVLVFQPTMIFLYLLTGSPVAGQAVQYATLILFAELARVSGNPLTKQEATWIIIGTPVASLYQWLIVWVYQGYFKFSPIAAFYGLTDLIPWFYSPSAEAWLGRSFWQPEWIPIMVVGLAYIFATDVCGMSLGLINYHLYVEQENLEFPLARPLAATVTSATTERTVSRLAMIGLAAFVSAVYTFVLYGVPIISTTWGNPINILPAPWTDSNRLLHLVLPGASFGIGTDPTWFAWGLVIPFQVSIGYFIGSFALNFVGNAILVATRTSTFGTEWFSGMSVALSWQRSMLYVWSNPAIGFALAVGIMPLLTRPSLLINTLKSLVGGKATTKPLVPLWKPLLTFLAGSCTITAMQLYLAPDLPIWLPFMMNMGYFFVFSLVSGRAAGVATTFDIPYIQQIATIGSGYNGIGGWFVPWPAFIGGAAWLQNFKVAELTKTRPTSLIKIWLAAPISLFVAFWTISAVWRVSPMPSERFPGIQAMWPVQATFQGLFISRPPGIFRPELILGGFGVGTVLYLVLSFAVPRIGIAPLVGSVTGAFSPLPNAFTIMIGSVIGELVSYVLGRKWWNEKRALLSAGLILGEGLIIVVGGSIALIVMSMWAMNY